MVSIGGQPNDQFWLAEKSASDPPAADGPMCEPCEPAAGKPDRERWSPTEKQAKAKALLLSLRVRNKLLKGDPAQWVATNF